MSYVQMECLVLLTEAVRQVVKARWLGAGSLHRKGTCIGICGGFDIHVRSHGRFEGVNPCRHSFSRVPATGRLRLVPIHFSARNY